MVEVFRGPVPVGWLEVAARLPGKSLHAGVALWITAGRLKSHAVPLGNIAGLKLGMDRNAKYRALAWLEGAGLISVRRKLGRSPLVFILPASLASASCAEAGERSEAAQAQEAEAAILDGGAYRKLRQSR